MEGCQPAGLLRDALARAAAYGRTTREDTEALARNLVAIGRYQARDALDGLGRSSRAAIVLVRIRAGNVAQAARRAPHG